MFKTTLIDKYDSKAFPEINWTNINNKKLKLAANELKVNANELKFKGGKKKTR